MALARDRAYRKLSTLAAIVLFAAVVVDVERLVSWSLTASSTAFLAASSSTSSLLPPAVPLPLSSKQSKGQVEEEGHALHLREDSDPLATAALDFVVRASIARASLTW
jgi:hypothetical protein